MDKKSKKRKSTAKSTVIQYCIIGAICLPFLVWFSILAETKWNLSGALTIFIMCLIILVIWLAWIGVRKLIKKRSDMFIRQRQENQKNYKIKK